MTTGVPGVSGRRAWQVVRTPRAGFELLATLLLILVLAPAATRAAPAATATRDSAGTYTNPIIAQTTPDPAIIKALDGYYYLIPTSDYWPGGAYHNFPIWRSTDLVHWTYVRDAFPQRPDWLGPNGLLFAPDLQYYNHKYYMYYAASDTAPLPKYGTPHGSAIGVAVADSPAGPWQDAGDSAGGSFQHGPIVPPRACTGTGCYFATIDPAEFTDQDGQKYLYYGSFFGGTLVQTLDPDGLHVSGPAIQVGHWDRYEGTYVIRHDVNGQRYYYDFSSTANCCSGPNTAYAVVVSRATSPLGPFVDQQGYPMERPAPQPAPVNNSLNDPASFNNGAEGGGYPTLVQNGNTWNGVGHNAIITDLSGHEWIVYHGVDENNGWVNGLGPNPPQITYRQGLIDRLDWTTGGWPVVNGGAGPSDGPMPAPATTPIFGDNFNATNPVNTTDCAGAAPGPGPAAMAHLHAYGGSWSVNPGDCTSGGYLTQSAATGQGLIAGGQPASGSYRTECDVRLESGSSGRYGCVVAYQQEPSVGAQQNGGRYVAVLLDASANTLVTVLYNNGHPIGQEQSTPLPVAFDHTDWHHLAIDLRTGTSGQPAIHVEVSTSDRDPLAIQDRALPAAYGQGGSTVGFITQDARADFDNVTVAPLEQAAVPEPQIPPLGASLPSYSDEFNGTLGPQWSWVREDPSKHGFVNGQLSITVNGDLYRDANNATNLLLENQPDGDYAIETKITFDPNNNFQQAGLLVYSDDDHYIKFGPHHHFSLNKILSGHESLEPLPTGTAACDVQPSPASNVYVKTYTRDQCPNEGEGWVYLTNPNPTSNGSTAFNPTVTDWLRIYRHGDVYTPYVSIDGTHWVRGEAWSLTPAGPGFPVRIGLFAFAGGGPSNVPALFDYVHVYRVGQ